VAWWQFGPAIAADFSQNYLEAIVDLDAQWCSQLTLRLRPMELVNLLGLESANRLLRRYYNLNLSQVNP